MPREFEATENTFLMKWTVQISEADQRLDRFLTMKYKKRSREFVKRIIRDGRVTHNQAKAKPSRILRVHDQVHVTSERGNEPEVDFKYRVVFEDKDILVIDKPGNLPVHPTGRFFFHTLLTQLRINLLDDSDPDNDFYIVHRLDRETSGMLVIAKHREAGAHLVDQFAERKPQKEYLALVHGSPTQDYFLTEAPIGKDLKSRVDLKMATVELDSNGEPLYLHRDSVLTAKTEFWVTERFAKHCVMRIKPHTGRQHQIRVHLVHIGHPLVGDKLYGASDEAFFRNLRGGNPLVEVGENTYLSRHTLHAAKLSFFHPSTNEWTTFETGFSGEAKEFIDSLRIH